MFVTSEDGHLLTDLSNSVAGDTGGGRSYVVSLRFNYFIRFGLQVPK